MVGVSLRVCFRTPNFILRKFDYICDVPQPMRCSTTTARISVLSALIMPDHRCCHYAGPICKAREWYVVEALQLHSLPREAQDFLGGRSCGPLARSFQSSFRTLGNLQSGKAEEAAAAAYQQQQHQQQHRQQQRQQQPACRHARLRSWPRAALTTQGSVKL